MSNSELRPFWAKYFEFNARLGYYLILLVCLPRFVMVLYANMTNNYGPIAIIMVISGLMPFILLSKSGRDTIGIRMTINIKQLVVAFFVGGIISFILYFIGKELYDSSFSNWYEYIGRTYNLPTKLTSQDRAIYFVIFAVTGMTFSPIGEEFFFRGIVHSSLAKQWGERGSSLMDSFAFAMTHISHFGLIYIAGGWQFLWMPTFIWVAFIFLLGLLFFHYRKTSGSIWGAVFCHSGFNLGMTYAIFYLL
ncbi:MAG: CPBP family intramembrane metalloprotease [Saprospiraceae bacterium]|nr:CPBP family intramembrane metalloprotease [Saprospiraceae bacterium]